MRIVAMSSFTALALALASPALPQANAQSQATSMAQSHAITRSDSAAQTRAGSSAEEQSRSQASTRARSQAGSRAESGIVAPTLWGMTHIHPSVQADELFGEIDSAAVIQRPNLWGSGDDLPTTDELWGVDTDDMVEAHWFFLY